MNKIPKSQSPFEQLQEVDADGKEWWNSRKLARVMGYGKYWNFERVIAKGTSMDYTKRVSIWRTLCGDNRNGRAVWH